MAETKATTGKSRYYAKNQMKYYEKNKEKLAKSMAEYYQKNKEKIKAQRRERYKNVEKARREAKKGANIV